MSRINTIKAILKDKQLILFGLSLALLMFLLNWLELRFVIFDHAFEIYAGAIAVVFTLLGIWLALKLAKPKTNTVIVEREVIINQAEFVFNQTEFESLGLSSRELDVLKGMSEGMSNQEIADKLFVSLNTIKTHSSRLFEKLDVKRRTQAIEKAKKLSIIP